MMNEESIDLPFGGNEAVDRMFVIHFPAWRRLDDCVDQENKIFKFSLSGLVVLCYTFSAKDFASKANLGSQAEWYRLYRRRQARDLQSDVGQQIPDLILPPLPSRPVFIFLLLVGPPRQPSASRNRPMSLSLVKLEFSMYKMSIHNGSCRRRQAASGVDINMNPSQWASQRTISNKIKHLMPISTRSPSGPGILDVEFLEHLCDDLHWKIQDRSSRGHV